VVAHDETEAMAIATASFGKPVRSRFSGQLGSFL
jgi:hypothetical protein